MKENCSLIIVDDDETLLDMLKNGLSLQGYHVTTVKSGVEALEIINKKFFDLMIVDVRLKDMNGLDLVKKVKILKPNIAIIVMTGFVEDFSYDKAIEFGASDFIKKPFTLKEIDARIRHVRQEVELRDLLLRDYLTGLYNRRGFFTLVEHLLKVAKRQKKGMFMLYADLDHLKQINDTWGHLEGDKALIDIANILKKNYRESDIIARIGGDEFVVIPVGSEGDRVELILERLNRAIELHNLESNNKYKLSLSAGFAYYDPENPCSIDELLSKGDKSMYEWKKIKQNS